MVTAGADGSKLLSVMLCSFPRCDSYLFICAEWLNISRVCLMLLVVKYSLLISATPPHHPRSRALSFHASFSSSQMKRRSNYSWRSGNKWLSLKYRPELWTICNCWSYSLLQGKNPRRVDSRVYFVCSLLFTGRFFSLYSFFFFFY